MKPLTIGDVARRAGLRTSAIRYHESVGPIPAPRRVGGQRHYDADTLARLAVVRMAQDAGFTIEKVRTLFAGFPEDTAAGDRWRKMAQRRLPEVDAPIAPMQAVRRVLEEGLACGCPTPACAAVGWNRVPDKDGAENTDRFWDQPGRRRTQLIRRSARRRERPRDSKGSDPLVQHAKQGRADLVVRHA